MTTSLYDSRIQAWPEPRFWWLQVCGWLLYPIFIHLAYTPADAPGTDWSLLPVYYIWEALAGFSLSLGIREVQKRLWNKSIWVAMTLSFVTVALAAEAWTLAKLVVYFEWFNSATVHDFWTTAGEWYPNSLTVLAAWSAIYYGFKYRNTLMDRERTLLTAQSVAKDAQLRMLRYQLNPHFLFNTLANICALISDDKAEKAKTMTMEISEFLRYSLAKDPLQTSSLQDEARVLEIYFNIEKIRYADRLNYTLDLASDTLNCQIPSMLLQPLVENAIKYAIAPSVTGGTITITSRIHDHYLVLCVQDEGHGQAPCLEQIESGIGIGMKNTQERLESFYGKQHSLEVSDVQPHGLSVQIRIPLTGANQT